MSTVLIPFSGAISVKSVLENDRREPVLLVVDPRKKTRDFGYIRRLAQNKGVRIQEMEREEMDATYGNNGGIVLLARERKEARLKAEKGMICFISGVQDPYNLGSLSRSLYAFGCKMLVLLPYDWSAQEQTIEKASAGAWDKLEVCYAGAQELIEFCKEQNLPLICANRKDAIPLEDYTFPERFVLAIGGALRGLPAAIEQASDQNLFISYENDFKNALDTPSATAIFSYAWHLQQRNH